MTIFCPTLKDSIFNNSGGEHLSKQRVIYGEEKHAVSWIYLQNKGITVSLNLKE